ncbi:MAG: large conductance mechanosensitive channel protein MscL [Deinococcales bacterium]
MLTGFRNFLFRGNVVELATAVIIATAFGGIVDAFTKSVIDPIFQAIGGAPNFDNALTIAVGASSFKLGLLISAIVNFLLKAAVIYFFIIRPFGPISAKLAQEAAAAAPTPPDVALLTEIRDLLKK